MKHENLSVKGMTCAACVTSVQKATAKLDGITNVNVNLTTEKLTFDYDIDKVSIDDVKKAVKAAGYEVLTETETADEHQLRKEKEINNLWTRFLVSAIFFITTTLYCDGSYDWFMVTRFHTSRY